METIKLKTKKKQIRWKRIVITLICAAIVSYIALIEHFRIQYKYYIVNIQSKKITLGISSDNNLIDKAVYSKINEAKNNNYQIAEYNLDTIVNKKYIFTWGKAKNKDNKIISDIENYVYVITYAYQVEDCIFPTSKKDYIENKLEEPEIKGVFINIKDILNDEQLDKCIETIEN